METLEVNQLLDSLLDIIPQGVRMKYLNKVVKYDFNKDLKLSKLDSWRGIYSNLTLDYNSSGKEITLEELIHDLVTSTKGKVFRGYKGGGYRMNIDTPVWADQSGAYNERMIIGVEDDEEFIIIKTLLKN